MNVLLRTLGKTFIGFMEYTRRYFFTLSCSASKYGILNFNVLIDTKVCGVCVCVWESDMDKRHQTQEMRESQQCYTLCDSNIEFSFTKANSLSINNNDRIWNYRQSDMLQNSLPLHVQSVILIFDVLTLPSNL